MNIIILLSKLKNKRNVMMQKKLSPAQSYLKTARTVAMRIAKRTGHVSADLVQQKVPLPVHLDHNILGALFRNGDTFCFVGYRKSIRKEAKGRVIRYYSVSK